MYQDKYEIEFDEEWKDIEGYEGLYQVSNLGNVKSLARFCRNKTVGFISKERVLTPRETKHGYLSVVLYDGKGKGKSARVHRLVAMAFLENENNHPIVMHIDNNKKNNNIENLKWGTYQENTIQAEKDGLMFHGAMKGRYGKDNPRSKKVAMYDKNGNFIKSFNSIREANVSLGKKETSTGITMCLKEITKSAHGYKWGYLNG